MEDLGSRQNIAEWQGGREIRVFEVEKNAVLELIGVYHVAKSNATVKISSGCW